MTTLDRTNPFVYGTVSVAPSPAASGGSMTFTTEGTVAAPCDGVIFPSGQRPLKGNAEEVRITGGAGTGSVAVTMTRAQSGTTARTVVVGDQVMCGITARMWNALAALVEEVQANIAGAYAFPGQKSFLLPPRAPEPVGAEDVATKAFVVGQTASGRPRSNEWPFAFDGEVEAGTSPQVPVAVLNEESRSITGLWCGLSAGTSIKVSVLVNGAAVPGLTNIVVTKTFTKYAATEAVPLKDGDRISIVRSEPTGTPEGLTTNVLGESTPGAAPGPPPAESETYSGFTAAKEPPSSWTPYAGGSLWNKPVPTTPTVHGESAAIVSTLLTAHAAPQPGNSSIYQTYPGTKDFGHPPFYAAVSDPEWTVKLYGFKIGAALDGSKIKGPSFMLPAGGSDHHLIVIQPNGVEWDFWNVKLVGKTIEAEAVSKTTLTGAGSGLATAADFALFAGIIRPEELMAGAIKHALFCTAGGCTELLTFGNGIKIGASNSAYVWPATHGGSIAAGSGKPPMGARLWLEMTLAEIAALGLPSYAKAIAVAMATYGGYIGDTSGGGFGFQLMSPQAYNAAGLPNPAYAWAAEQGLFKTVDGGINAYVLKPADTIPWSSKLRVLIPPSTSEPI